MKNALFWDVTPCGSCKNRHFGGSIASFIRVTRFVELGTTLAVTRNRSTLRRNTNRTDELGTALAVTANEVRCEEILAASYC
jgi:hypothetical protein